MNNNMLIHGADENIRITLEFLEDGELLKCGSSTVQRWEMDILVRRDVTCDELLGAVYAGIRVILTDKYGMDLKNNLSRIVYQNTMADLAAKPFNPERGNLYLRNRGLQEVSLRLAANRYSMLRRRMAELDNRYPHPTRVISKAGPEETERLALLVCWQVFMECYLAYSNGYPGSSGVVDSKMMLSEQYRCHPVIVRSTVVSESEKDLLDYEGAKIPLLWLNQKDHGSMTIHELGFRNGSKMVFDPVLWHRSAPLFEEWEERQGFPQEAGEALVDSHGYFPAQGEVYRLPQLSELPVQENIDVTGSLLPTLVTAGAAITVWTVGGVSAEPLEMLLFGATILGAAAGTVALNGKRFQGKYDNEMQIWCRDNSERIRTALLDIQARQKLVVERMDQAYPPASGGRQDLLHRALREDTAAFCRRPWDESYLKVRLGKTAEGSRIVASGLRIEAGTTAEHQLIGYQNFQPRDAEKFQLLPVRLNEGVRGLMDSGSGRLSGLPERIREEYSHLNNAPVLLNLREQIGVGLVGRSGRAFLPFLTNLLLDLCCHHRPEELQIVMMFEPTTVYQERQDLIHRFKNLPHFSGLFHDRSAFVFGEKDAWQIYDRLLEYMKGDRKEGDPHILVIAMEDYGLARHPLSEWLSRCFAQKRETVGMSMLMHSRAWFELPGYFTKIIRADMEQEWYLIPREHLLHAHNDPVEVGYKWYAFRPDPVPDESLLSGRDRSMDVYYRAFRAIGVRSEVQGALHQPPAYLELFRVLRSSAIGQTIGELTDACGEMKDADLAKLLEQQLSRCLSDMKRQWKRNHLEVILGRDHEGDVRLDLGDQADGPHLLIAGEGKSGKTEAVQSILLQLCGGYLPEMLRVYLVDPGGKGLSRSLKGLPHIVTYLDTPDMERKELLARTHDFLAELDAILVERKRLLMNAGFDRVEAYHSSGGQDAAQRESLLKQMPHLFVVLDHFDELELILAGAFRDRDRIDLSERLTELLKKAEGLGVHLIILSERADRRMSEELLQWLQTRICLKMPREVSERLLSSERAAASEMNIRGRAVLRRSGSSHLQSLQIVYSGGDIAARKHAPFTVEILQPGGRKAPFFDSETYIPEDPEDAELQIISSWGASPHSPQMFQVVKNVGTGEIERESRRQEYNDEVLQEEAWESTGDFKASASAHRSGWRHEEQAARKQQGQSRPTEKRWDPDSPSDPRPDWWYEEQAARKQQGQSRPTEKRWDPDSPSDPRPDWWYEEQAARKQQGQSRTAEKRWDPDSPSDPRPDWWYEEQAARKQQGQSRPTEKRWDPDSPSDPRPDWWYEEQAARKRQEQERPAGKRWNSDSPSDPRPKWWYEEQAARNEQQKENRKRPSYDEVREKVETERAQKQHKKWRAQDYQGKRYRVWTHWRGQKRVELNKNRAKRYFRPPIQRPAEKLMQVPRPDRELCRRKEIGMTQAQCFVQMIRKTTGMAEKGIAEPVRRPLPLSDTGN